nr:peptidoglycan-binding domain-containing protein [uncultured Desulfobacter sp.]
MSPFCKMRITQSLLVAFLFLTIVMGGGPELALGQEAPGYCGQLLNIDDFRHFSLEQGRALQGDLNSLGFGAGEVDGIIGPQTEGAIKRFCAEFHVQLEPNSPDALAEIVAYYASANKKKVSDKQENKDELLSYLLRNDDFKALPQEKALVENLKKLLDESFPDKKTFIETIEPLIKEETDQVDTYLSLLLQDSAQAKTYSLTDTSLNSLKIDEIPQNILEQIEQVKDLPYPSRDKLEEAVRVRINNLIQHYQMLPFLYAEETDSYSLTDTSLKKLESEGIPESIFIEFQKLEDVEFKERETLETLIQSKIDKLIEQYESLILKYAAEPAHYILTEESFQQLQQEDIPAQVLDGLQEVKDVEFADRGALEKAVAEKTTGNTENYLPLLVKHARLLLIIHRLNEKTLQELKDAGLPDSLLDQLRELKGQYYLSTSNFKSELQKILSDTATLYKKMVIDQTNRHVRYQLNEESFQSLEGNYLPDTVMNKLSAMEDAEYSDRDQLENQVRININGGAEVYLPNILDDAEKETSYRLTDDSFKKLRMAGIAPDIISSLENMKNIRYGKLEQLTTAARGRIDKVKENYLSTVIDNAGTLLIMHGITDSSLTHLKKLNIPDDLLDQLESLKGESYLTKSNFAKDVGSLIENMAGQYLSAIGQQAQVRVSYRLSKNSFDALRSGYIPDRVLEGIKDLEGREYGDKKTFEKAVRDKMEVLAGKYPALVSRNAVEQTTYTLTGESFKELKGAFLPDPLLLALQQLQKVDFADKSKFQEAVRKKIEEKIGQYGKYVQMIVDAAEEGQTYILTKEALDKLTQKDLGKLTKEALDRRGDEIPIQWKGAFCGCGDLSAIVYGFYPFWIATGKEQRLDFSLLSRIGYFGLTFNKSGAIEHKLDWQRDTSSFIREAHKYKTKVDLVIFKNNWQEWSGLTKTEKTNGLDTAVKNVVNLVKEQLSDPLSRLRPYISLGFAQTPSMGDGVTLLLENYPKDPESINILFFFIKKLGIELKKTDSKYFLNIFLPLEALGDDLFSYDNLGRLLSKNIENVEDESGEMVPYINNVLIFLQKPTSEHKKELRKKIENRFKGEQRRNILRKMVPVILQPDNANDEHSKQFKDDIIYFNDNFGGVGFWPLAMDNGGGSTDKLFEVVKREFQKKDPDFVQGLLTDYAPWLCNWACPNRWLIRIIWDTLVAFFVIYFLISLFICELRTFARRYYLIFGGGFLLTVLLIYISTVCDPFWKDKTTEIAVGIFLVAFLIMILGYLKKLKQEKFP